MALSTHKGKAMKNLIAIILVFFTSSIFAMGDNDVYVTDNDAGGKIYLFFDQCPVSGLSDAKVSLTTLNTYGILGCWIFYDAKIYVIWFPEGNNTVESVYDPDIFILEKLL
jgi:hypothetical protein